MSDIIQNVKIKYIADSSDLDGVQRQFLNITNEEQKTYKALQEVDTETKKVAASAKTTGDAFKTSGDKANQTVKQTTSNFSGLNSVIKNIGPSILAAFSVGALISFGSKAIEVTSEFQRLGAVLTNTLGSKALGDIALQNIQQFAAKTNYSVLEITEAFVKLANQGFVPTNAELENLADLANSTGKSFDQLTEAILDAQTGQFERLKEFGILAQKNGDQVSFSFKGVTTQVKFTNEAIREFLVGLGDLQGVTGSTAAISETLGGRISNLGDAFDQLLNTLGTGSSGLLGNAIDGFTTLLNLATQFSKTNSAKFSDAVNAEAGKILETFRELKDADIEAEIKRLTLENEDLADRFKLVNDEAVNLAGKRGVLSDLFSDNADRAKFFSEQLEGLSKQANINEKVIEALSAQLQKLRDKALAPTATNGLLESLKKQIDELNKKKITLTSEADIRSTNIELQKLQKEYDRLNKLGIDGNNKANAQKLKDDEAYYQRRIALVQAAFKNENDLNQHNADQQAKAAQELIDLQQKQSDAILSGISSDEAAKKAVIQNQNVGKLLKKSQVDIDKELLQVTQDAAVDRLYVINTNEEEQLKLIDRRIAAEKAAAHQEYLIAQEAAAQDPTANVALIEAQHQAKLSDIDEKGEEDRANIQKSANQKRLENTRDSNQAEIELIKSKEQQKRAILQQATQTLQGIGDSYFQYQADQRNAELAQLQSNYNVQAKLAGDNQQLQQIAQNRFNAQQLAVKRKQAMADKEQAEFDIAINTAVSISKVAYNPYLIALVAALGLAQEAAVASRPLPRYNKGTKHVPGVDVGDKDSVIAELTVGEAVIPREKNKKYSGLVGGIIDGTLDPVAVDFILNKKDFSQEIKVVNDNKEILKGIKQGIKEALGNQPTYELSFDERGYTKSLKKNGSVTSFINNYYRTPSKNG